MRAAWQRDPLAFLLRFLTVLTSVSLAITGQVNIAIALTVPVSVYLGLRLQRRGWQPGWIFEIFFHLVALAGIVYFLGLGVARLRLLAGSVELIFIGQAYYALRPPGPKELGRLQLLAFFQILALSSSTTNIMFVVPFLIYLVLAPLAFTLMAMEGGPRRGGNAEDRHPVTADMGLVRSSLSASVIALAAAAVLFPLVPRYEAGLMSELARDDESSISGFSERVRFGDISGIKDSGRVVLRAKLSGRRPERVLWRGIALDRYDGQAWSLSLADSYRIVAEEKYAGQAAFRVREVESGEGRSEALVQLEPLRTKILFHLPDTSLIASDQLRGIDRDAWGNLYGSSVRTGRLAYTLRTAVREPAVALDALERERTLSLPPLDSRIEDLATEITEGLQGADRIARRMEAFLSTRYGYTLDVDDRGETDPLASFLFERREGHCEYFASAMAVMMRTLGIPARMVNGFQQGSYSNFTGTWTVRMRDAHSWVEVWIPGEGWTAYDPTPAVASGSGQGFLEELKNLGELGVQWWDERVIGFNIYNQINAWLNLRDWIAALHGRLGPAGLLLIPLLPLLVVALVILRRMRGAPERVRPETEWMARVLRVLERRGWRRSRGQTLASWADAVAAAAGEPAARLPELVKIYYEVRFGGAAPDDRRVRSLMESVGEVPPRKAVA